MAPAPCAAEVVPADEVPSFAERIRAATQRTDAAEVVSALIVTAIDAGLCDTAGIIGALPRQDLTSVLASDDVAAEADQRQCELDCGPALDALRTREIVMSADLEAEARWSRWIGSDAAGPIGAALSVPLNPDRGLGALTFYRSRPQPFSADDVENAATVAAQVCLTLRHRVEVDNLIRAVESRTIIGQAQGILMERYRITAADSFAALTRYSQRHNVKLAVLAQQLAATGDLDGLAELPGIPAPRVTRRS